MGLFPHQPDVVRAAKFRVFRCGLLVCDKGGNIPQAAECHRCVVPELGIVRDQDDMRAVRHDAALDLRFEERGVAHTGFHRDARRAEERLGDAQVGQRLLCGNADKRAGRRIVYAAEGDQADVVELCGFHHGWQRMGDDRRLDAQRQMAQHVDRCRTGVDKNGIPVAYLACGKLTDPVFRRRVQTGAHGQRHDLFGRDGSDTAVYLGNMPAFLQLVQVAPNGVFGHLEHVTKLVD